MEPIELLRDKVNSISDKDYGAYQSLKGDYDYQDFILSINQIPKDPYAPPHTGIYCVQLENTFNKEYNAIFNSKFSEIAFCDFLARSFHYTASLKSKGRRGTGNSGLITIAKPGQAVLYRNSVIANREYIEVRFFMGLPANGRTINSKICNVMLLKELPEIIKYALFADNLDTESLVRHIRTTEDAEHIRAGLDSLDLVAFIADGSILPRKSGTSDEPLERATAIPFVSPENLAVEINTPHSGKIKGMGIPKGTTLIVGGGYHGKSTLLHAIEMGIYNHIPGDGRERCISGYGSTKIRAYSGRYIEKVDISMFINNLPLGKDTIRFSSENASGSTSQAASIMEAIEVNASALLMDEDTCATNFMVRDQKMQHLVGKEDEPITTLIDRVKRIYTEKGISTILVLGGIGDYFEVSDTVIQMKEYIPIDVTKKAQEISNTSTEKRIPEDTEHSIAIQERVPVEQSINPLNDYNKKRSYATEINRIHFGKNIIDLSDVEQIIELSQTKSIAEALLYLKKYINDKTSLKEIIEKVLSDIEKYGLDILSGKTTGQLAQFRGIDLAFAINRLRDFKIL